MLDGVLILSSAENWRGAPDLGPRISEGEGPPAHHQSLLQGLPPPPLSYLISWAGKVNAGLGESQTSD